MAVMSDWAQWMLSETARSLEGSHYVWGAAGAAPGQQNGAPYRPGMVGLTTIDLGARKPSVYAATCSADGLHVCGGNYRRLPFNSVIGDLSDEWLVSYLEKQRAAVRRGLSPEPDSDGTTPRQVQGYTVTSVYAWGSDCRGVRHFDCIGFVNYCLSVVCNRDRLASGFSGEIAWHKQYTQAVSLSAPPVAGDILTKRGNGHIAILIADGLVAQAEDTAHGVSTGPYAGSSWEYRGRHSDGLFY
jgi:hypothetical protein